MAKKTVHVEVIAKKGEDGEHLIKRFLRKMKKIKLLEEIKAHEYFISDSEKNHEKDKRKEFLIEKKRKEEEALEKR